MTERDNQDSKSIVINTEKMSIGELLDRVLLSKTISQAPSEINRRIVLPPEWLPIEDRALDSFAATQEDIT